MLLQIVQQPQLLGLLPDTYGAAVMQARSQSPAGRQLASGEGESGSGGGLQLLARSGWKQHLAQLTAVSGGSCIEIGNLGAAVAAGSGSAAGGSLAAGVAPAAGAVEAAASARSQPCKLLVATTTGIRCELGDHSYRANDTGTRKGGCGGHPVRLMTKLELVCSCKPAAVQPGLTWGNRSKRRKPGGKAGQQSGDGGGGGGGGGGDGGQEAASSSQQLQQPAEEVWCCDEYPIAVLMSEVLLPGDPRRRPAVTAKAPPSISTASAAAVGGADVAAGDGSAAPAAKRLRTANDAGSAE